MKRLLIAGGLALACIAPTAGTALADPKTPPIELTCLGETYQITVNGNGQWTPAHDNNSSLVGVPIAFGELTVTFTPTGGEPQTEIIPPTSKRNVPRSRNAVIECTFFQTGSDPEGTFEVSGSVTILVPRIKP